MRPTEDNTLAGSRLFLLFLFAFDTVETKGELGWLPPRIIGLDSTGRSHVGLDAVA